MICSKAMLSSPDIISEKIENKYKFEPTNLEKITITGEKIV